MPLAPPVTRTTLSYAILDESYALRELVEMVYLHTKEVIKIHCCHDDKLEVNVNIINQKRNFEEALRFLKGASSDVNVGVGGELGLSLGTSARGTVFPAPRLSLLSDMKKGLEVPLSLRCPAT